MQHSPARNFALALIFLLLLLLNNIILCSLTNYIIWLVFSCSTLGLIFLQSWHEYSAANLELVW